MEQLPLDLALAPAPTLDNFAPGPNAQVVALLRQWLDGALDVRSLYLWGPEGAGKSHLLQAAVGAARAGGKSARYVASGMGFARGLADGMDLLAVDQAQSLSAPGQAALFTLLNEAGERGLRLLVAADNAPAGLALRPDAATRLSQGLVLQLRLLSDEDKRDALQQHARERGFELAVEAAEYLLRHGRRDLATLMRVLDATDRYSLQVQRPVTVPLLREVLQQADAGQGGYLPTM